MRHTSKASLLTICARAGGNMKVLIVESERPLAAVWSNHLRRLGMDVSISYSQSEAISHLAAHETDIIVLDLILREGAAFAVADYASYRSPETRIIFVTSASFFSDGSIFSFAANACALVQRSTLPDDLAAIVEHYGSDKPPAMP